MGKFVRKFKVRAPLFTKPGFREKWDLPCVEAVRIHPSFAMDTVTLSQALKTLKTVLDTVAADRAPIMIAMLGCKTASAIILGSDTLRPP